MKDRLWSQAFLARNIGKGIFECLELIFQFQGMKIWCKTEAVRMFQYLFVIVLVAIIVGCVPIRSNTTDAAVFISEDEVLVIAEQALAEKLGPGEYRNQWLKREYLSAFRFPKVNENRVWTVQWRAPIVRIAGGVGRVEVDAVTGAVLSVHLPAGQR